ncbi:MAG: hypothetical protein GY780_01610 [bacterium]|nr:hypothetical protein [bacterium]
MVGAEFGQVLLLDPPAHKPGAYLVFWRSSLPVTNINHETTVENESHGAIPKTALKVAEYGAQVLVSGNGPGSNATTVLKNTGLNANENSSSEKLAICVNTAYFG